MAKNNTKTTKRVKTTKKTRTVNGVTVVTESVMEEVKTVNLSKREIADQNRCLAWFKAQQEENDLYQDL